MGKQSEYNPKSCPEIGNCDVRINLNHFNLLCNTKNFIRCNHFCKKRNLLKNPMEWLTQLAINQADASIEQEVPSI